LDEVRFKQHDKREVIGGKVNGFPALQVMPIWHSRSCGCVIWDIEHQVSPSLAK
jgi:hypothetical protein